MNDDLVARIRLVRSPGIGPVTFGQLLARFGGAEQALAAVPDLASRGGGRAPNLFSEAAAKAEISRVEGVGARYLSLRQGLYPRALAELADAPPLLIVKGDPNLLDRPLVAIVGARNASAAACRFARGLAHELGRGRGGRIGAGTRNRQRGGWVLDSQLSGRRIEPASQEVIRVNGTYDNGNFRVEPKKPRNPQ